MAAALRSPPSDLSPTKPLLAIYLSAHGYGHCVRTSALVERLVAHVDCELDVTASCPASLWPHALRTRTRSWRDLRSDAGVVQAHDLAVDRDATAVTLEAWQASYPRRVAEEAARLRAGARVVLGDVPPLAFAAAREAGVPAFALANFSWDWIYASMGFATAAVDAADAYRSARILFELEPAAPMAAFSKRVSLGVLGRIPRTPRRDVRERLRVGAGDRFVLIAFKAADACTLPAPHPGVRYVYPDACATTRTDVVAANGAMPFIDLVAAADAVVAKAGYGIIGDTAACGTRLLYALRAGFPEDEVLGRWLERRRGSRRVETPVLARGAWLPELEELLAREPDEPPPDRTAPPIEMLATALTANA